MPTLAEDMAVMLKEWSSAVGALESGEQHILLRKGGIHDIPSGFSVKDNRFWLYPTWEHQDSENIRSAYRRHLERKKPANNTNVLTSYVDVLEEADVMSDDIIREMKSFHILSSKYVDARKSWQPQRPIKAILLRVYRTKPITIPILDEYAGCISWLNADVEVGGGQPVINDVQAEELAEKFKSIVS